MAVNNRDKYYFMKRSKSSNLPNSITVSNNIWAGGYQQNVIYCTVTVLWYSQRKVKIAYSLDKTFWEKTSIKLLIKTKKWLI